ncbi:MAG TPA: radical SAM protein [Candidatus Paceibacterota bacterium]|nr:radical SAM protein [Candidatus Paceibacterota bacterium]
MKVLFLYNRFESLGIEILSAILKEKKHEVKLAFDPQLFNDGYLNIPYLSKRYDYTQKILKYIKEYQPEVICFSVLTDNYQWALKLGKIIKNEFNIPIIFGGVHVTSVPEEVMSNDFIDFAIIGEGDIALVKLLDCIENNKDYKKIKNLVFRKKGEIIKNDVGNLIKNLNSIPFPDKDIFYEFIPFAKKTYSIMTGRGCPFSCTYCFNSMYKKIYKNKGVYLRKRSVDNVIQELKERKLKYNYNFVSILDDVFMTDEKWTEEFCKKYLENINLPFRCIGHVNCINENIVQMLKKSGCKIIQIGVQTTCDYTRKNVIKRYETNDAIKRAAEIIKKYGISLEIDHIIGFPYETENEQIEAAKFYNEIRPEIINCYWLKCFPETEIIQHMIKDKKLIEKDVESINKGLEASYISGGSVKNMKEMKKFFSLFNMISILPKSFVNYIINHKLYYLTNFGKTFMIFIRSIKSIFSIDIRLLEFFYFYKRYIFKSIRLN